MTHTHTCVCWHLPGTTWSCTTFTMARESAAQKKWLAWWGSGCRLSQEVKAGRSEDMGGYNAGRKSWLSSEMTYLWLIYLVSYNSTHVNSIGINICHHGGNSTYSCCVATNVQGEVTWLSDLRVFEATVKKNNIYIYAMIKKLLFNCEYIVQYCLSTPAFVCVLAVFLTRKGKRKHSEGLYIYMLIHLSH